MSVKSINNINIVIIGGSHHNTLGVIRSLGEEGYRPSLILLAKKDYKGVSKSRYLIDVFICQQEDECINYLILQFGSTAQKTIIFATTDEVAKMLDENRETLGGNFILPVCSEKGKLRQLMDKNIITDLASSYGIATPKSWVIKNREYVKDITFPCLAKPLSSLTGHKSDIKECQNKAALNAIINDANHCSDYLVQELIPKEKEISILGMISYDRKEIVFSGCIDKLRTSGRGSSSFAVMINNDFFQDEIIKLKKLLLSTGYTGLFSAEYLLKDGVYYFLEINFRNDGNGYVPTAAGLNLPYLWLKSCISPDYIQDITTPKYPCYFMVEIADFSHVTHHNISFRKWNKDRKKVNCFLLYNRADKRPFFYVLKSILKDHLRLL